MQLDDLVMVMDHFGCRTRRDLEALLDEAVDPDAWIDWDVSSASELVVCLGARGTALAYPFSDDDVFAVLHELESEVAGALELVDG